MTYEITPGKGLQGENCNVARLQLILDEPEALE